jgi:hypothetical protein
MNAARRASLILFLLCLPAAVRAQQAEDAVTVTATRTERPSLEVPASIDTLYGDDIHFGRAEVNLSESLGRVPGIVAQNRQNYAQDLQISSRGFGARSTFGIRGLRLLVDGIPASMPDGQGQVSHIDLGSADRIEVLRGPFAVMYGNASGGVINIFTRDGAAEQGLEGRLEAGSFGTRRESIRNRRLPRPQRRQARPGQRQAALRPRRRHHAQPGRERLRQPECPGSARPDARADGDGSDPGGRQRLHLRHAQKHPPEPGRRRWSTGSNREPSPLPPTAASAR